MKKIALFLTLLALLMSSTTYAVDLGTSYLTGDPYDNALKNADKILEKLYMTNKITFKNDEARETLLKSWKSINDSKGANKSGSNDGGFGMGYLVKSNARKALKKAVKELRMLSLENKIDFKNFDAQLEYRKVIVYTRDAIQKL